MNLKVLLASAIVTGCLGGAAVTYFTTQAPSSEDAAASIVAAKMMTKSPQPKTIETAQTVAVSSTGNRSTTTPPTGPIVSTPKPPVIEVRDEPFVETPIVDAPVVETPVVKVPPVTPNTPTVKPLSDAMSNVIVPGQRFGSITAKTTHAELVATYGQAKLEDSITYGPEGMGQWPATIVNMGPGQQVKVTWTDQTRSQVTRAQTTQDNSAWRTADGLKVGLPLASMRQMIGKFEILGFEWDYAGRVLLKHQPRLQGLMLSMRVSPDSIQQNPTAYQQVMGDQIIPASDARWQSLDTRIGSMEVLFK
ncbi:hypothetical protein IQ266_20985 [filamentous cyanobacterium LEGE 11480]|uniref:Uncharacterized protein n=1 Tax=Romeriopsis navalis LEGE 11480 TaxID=2777977 RepID=A0A928VU13_9CYAN|nr:hypothetical protein [Romeriopsis navalis]MBE9032219.1 hypothetical protein [Romeriopsis navalis LEGE 11480]